MPRGGKRVSTRPDAKRAGRPKEYVTIRLPVEAGAQLQELMLREWPDGVTTPEALVAWLIKRETGHSSTTTPLA